MLTTLFVSLAPALSPLPAVAMPAPAGPALGSLEVSWSAPAEYFPGEPFEVDVSITAAESGAVVAGWMMTPGAFTIDGQALGERLDSEPMKLPVGFTISGQLDLGPYIQSDNSFQLAYAGELLGDDPFVVSVMRPVPEGQDMMELADDELGAYRVLMNTNQGEMLMEFWPEAAPDHVRNFLDLCQTGFYEGITFHRVIPGFMIQGGDPTGTGSGDGPRRLNAEFSTDERFAHVPGVLSMARSNDPNSASCQFFVMHGKAPHLDGSYSAFGKLVRGLEVVEKIVAAPRAGERPREPQTIVSTKVYLAAGGDAAQTDEGDE